MTKKLEGNGLWESSRMILPEYRKRILQASTERDRRKKAILHEDELETIAEAVRRSLALQLTVRLELYGEYGSEWTEGIVTDVSPLQGMLKLENESGRHRIAYPEIVGAQLITEV
ncbi:YolD-like family protein [Saccharibacillus kuerlensis]|uniref:YolD-like protein n=1 Tax=Saccharibacillus kuerlensis TaxID=459527 RepID=A0ABQ2L4Z6_9BACL|nr:YolD-like family protein [Saccharibacillus kuerlensis]GGO03719.1 hypothetical protein GCM10010969_28180 [Saccharibacillus kuerlensis]